MTSDLFDGENGEASASKAQLRRIYGEIAGTYGTALDLMDVFGRDLVAAAGIATGDRVLDIACGRGACLRPASETVGATGSVWGIDLSPEMVTLLSRDLRRDGVTNAQVVVDDAEHLKMPHRSFDVITCGFAVHHFPHLPIVLATCQRLLRDNGRFAASTFADGTLDYPWVFAVLEETGIIPPARDRSRAAAMMTAPTLTRSLTEAEFVAVVTTTTRHRFLFADAHAYLSWVRTQGLGTIINRLGPSEIQRFEQACEQRLDEHRTPDGYELLKSVDHTVATRG